MATKANAAPLGNDPLFANLNQPLKRTSSKTPARRRSTLADKGPDLMQFNPPGETAPIDAEPELANDLPRWATEPPIQMFITYTNQAGEKLKLHVVPYHDITTQD